MVVAFQHCEFIGHESAIPLLAKADIADDLDGGTIILPGEEGLTAFVSERGKLRVWGASLRSSLARRSRRSVSKRRGKVKSSPSPS